MSPGWLPLIISVSLFASLGNTLLKVGATRSHADGNLAPGSLLRAYLRPLILAGGASYALSQVLWITELRVVDLSLAYPLQIGINFILITVISWKYLKEPMTWWKLLGMALIFSGISLMTAS